ncbi:hypothetical protein lerEdw1_009356, partial [Lerista edwardsae]
MASSVTPAVRKPKDSHSSVHLMMPKRKVESTTSGPLPKKIVSLPALKKPGPTIVALPYPKPGLGVVYPVIGINVRTINVTTPATTDGYQLFDPIEPTLLPFVVGLPGPKGDPGPLWAAPDVALQAPDSQEEQGAVGGWNGERERESRDTGIAVVTV